MEYQNTEFPKLYYKHIIHKFNDELEREFNDYYYKQSLSIVRVALAIAFILYALFIFLDILTLPVTLKITWIIRFAFVCPFILIIFILSFRPFFKKFMQLLLCITTFALGIGIIMMIYFAQKNEFGYNHYYTGIFLVLLWAYALARIKFTYVSITCWSISIIYGVTAVNNYIQDFGPDFLPMLGIACFFFISANIIGMAVSFTIEYYMRNDFFLKHKLLLANKKIEEEKKSKTDFFVKIAHETKTPLTLITNYMDTYIKETSFNPKLQLIKQNMDKLSRDIVNFLDIEKLEKGMDIYVHDKLINLSEIIANKIILFKEMAEKKHIILEHNIMTDLYIKADPTAIDRIINNLLDNALKYNKDNGKIKIELHSDGKYLILSVEDTGIGIAIENIDKILLPYYQERSKKNYSDGIGMGLFIVKRIVESLQGKISIQSKPGQRTKFILSLPKHHLKDEEVVEVEDEVFISNPVDTAPVFNNLVSAPYDENKSTIFVVEDNRDMIHFLQLSLHDNYNFYYAFDGKDALSKIKTIPKPDLIISDIMMENMDGFQFIEELAIDNKYNTIPIIFLTAKTTTIDKIKGINAGAISYMYKPFSINELKAKIKTIITNKNNLINEMKNKVFNAIYKDSYPDKEESKFYLDKICIENNLSIREKEVFLMLLEGKSYKLISKELSISIHTVKSHCHNLYDKLKVKSRKGLQGLFN